MMADERDNTADEMAARFRSPPGWSAAIERAAAVAFDAALSAGAIRATYCTFAELIVEELPPSDERERLLARLTDLTALALGRWAAAERDRR